MTELKEKTFKDYLMSEAKDETRYKCSECDHAFKSETFPEACPKCGKEDSITKDEGELEEKIKEKEEE